MFFICLCQLYILLALNNIKYFLNKSDMILLPYQCPVVIYFETYILRIIVICDKIGQIRLLL